MKIGKKKAIKRYKFTSYVALITEMNLSMIQMTVQENLFLQKINTKELTVYVVINKIFIIIWDQAERTHPKSNANFGKSANF